MTPQVLTFNVAIKAINNGDIIWDIGNLDEATRRKLDELAKKGAISKTRAFWPYFHTGTIRKTCFMKKN